MQAEIRLRRARVRGAVVGIALGLAALAVAAGVIATHGGVAPAHTNSAPAILASADGRASGATQERIHGDLSGGEDTTSLPGSGHGNLP